MDDQVKYLINKYNISPDCFSDKLIHSWETKYAEFVDSTNIAQFVIDSYENPVEFIHSLDAYIKYQPILNDIKKQTENEKRIKKNKYNKYQREYYNRTIRNNPTKIRGYTPAERKRKKARERQMLLSTEQGNNKKESKN